MRLMLLKYICKMLAAFVAALLVANGLCYFYYNPAVTMTNKDGYTTSKQKANKIVHFGTEGYGRTATDSYGFYNDGEVSPNAADIICIGSSQTEALQVDNNRKYVYLLNKMDSHHNYYSLGVSGQFLVKSLPRLPLIPRYFPQTQLIIAETPRIPSLEEWQDVSKQLETGNIQIEDHNWKENITIYRLAREVSILQLFNKKIKDRFKASANDSKSTVNDDNERYKQAADSAMSLLREKMPAMPLVIVYLPPVKLERSGVLSNQEDVAKVEAVREACERQNIKFVDMWPTYLQNYEAKRVVPYGFANSSVASGHLNAEGHRMIALTLNDILTKEGLNK